MKKLFLGLVATAVFLGCLSVSFAADTNTGLVATVSNISPNDQKLVVVAEFTDLANNRIGQNAKKMTIEELTTDRAMINVSSSLGGVKLCEVESIRNPVMQSGGICVSAQKLPAIMTVATFKHGMGAPANMRTISRKDFQGAVMAIPADGVNNLDCQVKNGRSTGVCRIASSK